jgi:hypothetical protein
MRLDDLPRFPCSRVSRAPLVVCGFKAATTDQITPRGRHYYFESAQGLRPSVGKIAKGVDVRAGNLGYVIDWSLERLPTIKRPLAPWPQWLLDLANAKNEGCTLRVGTEFVSTQRAHPPLEPTINLCRRTDHILRVVEDAEPGTRNQRLYWAACRLGEIVAEGRLQLVVAEQLLRSAAHLCGLVRDDGARGVMATIASGLRRGSRDE